MRFVPSSPGHADPQRPRNESRGVARGRTEPSAEKAGSGGTDHSLDPHGSCKHTQTHLGYALTSTQAGPRHKEQDHNNY